MQVRALAQLGHEVLVISGKPTNHAHAPRKEGAQHLHEVSDEHCDVVPSHVERPYRVQLLATWVVQHATRQLAAKCSVPVCAGCTRCRYSMICDVTAGVSQHVGQARCICAMAGVCRGRSTG